MADELRKARRSRQAYFVVNPKDLTADQWAEALEDVNDGGSTFGLRIVETAFNGPAQSHIYGVYYGPDEDKWKAFLGGKFDEPDEDEVAAIRAQADASAEATAKAVREQEEEALRKIDEGEDDAPAIPAPAPAPNKNRR